ncbi:MAG: class I SAM-dependent methyltransferase [Deltaproteobacteria bacterium]|nr:class I SAM-dependent methyltransferase [Candidatus Zymogenaceae bacterium]
MKVAEYKVITDPKYGFKRIDPVPTDEELRKHYYDTYYSLVSDNRGVSMKRLLERDTETQLEINWLEQTVYTDIEHILRTNLAEESRSLLEVGCGTGDFLAYLSDRGWDCEGVEPSQEATEYIVKEKGIRIQHCFFEDFVADCPEAHKKYDVILLMNVLEHVPRPDEFLNMTKKVLKPSSGIVCIKIPNDFSRFQELAEQVIDEKKWWVQVPDHINYFDFSSIELFLNKMGFHIIEKVADFPMEFFLLSGDNYINKPDVGSACHKKRRRFEMSIPGDLRRSLYVSLAQIGVGRECTVFASYRE